MNRILQPIIYACCLTSISHAAAVVPISYDTINGGSGAFTYYDDLYNGIGDNSTDYANLSGGTGDLTDGVIANQHWGVTPGPYVGWASRNVDIAIQFADTIDFQSVRISYDDDDGNGGVDPPASVTINGTLFTITDQNGATPRTDLFSLAGMQTNSLLLQFAFRNEWVMISELQFEGTVVPEPGSALLTAVAAFLVGFARRWAVPLIE